jgi:hypothetical protein
MQGWDRDRQLYIDLQQQTRFQRSWWQIYAAALAYAVVLFPGTYRVGRRARDWRTYYVVFLGAAVFFSVLFLQVGRVTGVNGSRLRSLAIAHQIRGRLYDVTQWSCVGAADSDTYRIEHPGSGRLYATCQEVEPVKGSVFGAGHCELRLPVASTCTVLHRARMDGPELGIAVEAVEFNAEVLSSFRVRTKFPIANPNLIVGYYGRSVYPMRLDGDGQYASVNARQAANYLWEFSFDETVRWSGMLRAGRQDDLRNHMRQLVGNSLGLNGDMSNESLELPPEILRICVMAPAPREFAPRESPFPDDEGDVLYVIDVPVRPPLL